MTTVKTNTLEFDAQALREKILDLAMRGKLVPQDPNDEPASVLLEKIKAEKEQLIKEKKIKKSKPLAPITDDEKPFDIPDSWEWIRLGDAANSINDGIHFKPKYVKSGIPFATAKNISSGELDLSNTDYISENDYLEYKNKVNPKMGDLLLSKDGTIGVSAINTTNKKFGLLSSIAVVKTNHKLVRNEFLNYAIENKYTQKQIRKNIRGITYRHWNLKRINETIIPFPPLEEQSRIVAKIAQLFALLRKVESSTQQYAKLQTLLKSKVLDLAMRGKLVKQDPHDEPASVLLEKIKAEKEKLVKEGKIKKSKPLPPITDDEKPFDIPDSWEWVRLGELVDVKGGKRVPKGSQLKDIQDYKPYIRVSDMKHGTINTSKLKYATKSIYEQIHNYFISSEDIYFSIAGTIGKVGEIPQFLDGALLTENASKLVLFDDNKIKKDYLIIVLGSELIKLQHRKVLSRVTQPKLALSKLKNTIIPFPPLSEQNLITKKIRTITKLL